MGMAVLNVWIRDRRCRVVKRAAHLHIDSCCGEQVLGKEILDGHGEVSVPPGCYILRAGMRYPGQSNIYTHDAMVIVTCDAHACVNLILPKFIEKPKDNVADVKVDALKLFAAGGCAPATALATAFNGLIKGDKDVATVVKGLMRIAEIDPRQMRDAINAEREEAMQNMDEIPEDEKKEAKEYMSRLEEILKMMG